MEVVEEATKTIVNEVVSMEVGEEAMEEELVMSLWRKILQKSSSKIQKWMK